MQIFVFIFLGWTVLASTTSVPPPPSPESIHISTLPLPPVVNSSNVGACTLTINPHGTGCIGQVSDEFQAGDFTPDGNHIVVNVVFVGAPASPDPAGIYTGEQLILVKTDNSTFSNGDSWKCLSCGVPAENAVLLDLKKDYPHSFRSGTKALWGHNILECGGELLISDKCTPNKTHIYPIHWPITADGSGAGGSPREMRLHPDDVHMGWSSFTTTGGQFCYFGRLSFNAAPTIGEPLAPRYDLINVNLLVQLNGVAPLTANGTELQFHPEAISVGELRGFSGRGDEIIYIGSTREANNIDLFAVHVLTGVVRRLTSHPEYADPIAFSADNDWFVTMDTRGSDRQMWMSGMRQVPPLIDLITVTAASSTRNNYGRRFFQPILIDRYGDRDDYYGQRINAAGDVTNGSVNDPNWNGRADPAFSLDSTKITFWQALVISPACGGINPLACPVSTAQGGRTYRVMLANLTSRPPKSPAPVFPVPDAIPWATPFPPGASLPSTPGIPAGNYTLRGRASGVAEVQLVADPLGLAKYGTVAINYTNFSDDSNHVLNGYEQVTTILTTSQPWLNKLDWYSDLVQTGIVQATKKTSVNGFHLMIDAALNVFNANGTLTTTINGVVYSQPANGT
ncbi:hypothetical protein BGZ60DRAFT_387669 [Tricladium varicosporioides]|nr:hypothetical protein BGZ60DRAFT_387669 [Hymenoscyphus varicosporioides]